MYLPSSLSHQKLTFPGASAAAWEADLFMYGGRIKLTSPDPLPLYPSGTLIDLTVFGGRAFIVNQKQDINMSLAACSVASLSSTQLEIIFPSDFYFNLTRDIWHPEFTFTTMYLRFGDTNITMGTHCRPLGLSRALISQILEARTVLIAVWHLQIPLGCMWLADGSVLCPTSLVCVS